MLPRSLRESPHRVSAGPAPRQSAPAAAAGRLDIRLGQLQMSWFALRALMVGVEDGAAVAVSGAADVGDAVAVVVPEGPLVPGSGESSRSAAQMVSAAEVHSTRLGSAG